MINKISKTTGSYAINGDYFPVDAAYLEEMEHNADLVAVLGNIADGGGEPGTGYILRGCTDGETPGTLNDGYVFIRTAAYSDGEVLYFEGGYKTTNIAIQEDAIAAAGGNNPAVAGAYKHRFLRPAVAGDGTVYAWTALPRIDSISAIAAKNALQDDAIASLTETIADMRPPIGTVHMWAAPTSKTLPAGYLLCDGRAIAVAEYAELYAVIGDAYGVNAAKTEFNIPDMRGMFAVGQKSSDPDYSEVGKTGGEKQHALSIEEMPAHDHDYNFIANYGVDGGYGSGSDRASGPAKVSKTGGGLPHENRPPFFVVTYIIRAK